MSYKQQILRGVQLEESANKVQLLLDRLNSIVVLNKNETLNRTIITDNFI